jgi:hypothetical protein
MIIDSFAGLIQLFCNNLIYWRLKMLDEYNLHHLAQISQALKTAVRDE